jgi:phosphoribosylpyrophosphate synthetase
LTSKAAANIAASPLGQVFVTNSLPQKRNEAEIPNLRVIDMTPMVAKAIWRIHRHKSLRKLFHDEHLS